jgi:hypothetical protein
MPDSALSMAAEWSYELKHAEGVRWIERMMQERFGDDHRTAWSVTHMVTVARGLFSLRDVCRCHRGDMPVCVVNARRCVSVAIVFFSFLTWSSLLLVS